MSLLKAQVRVAVTNDIGADLDDQLEHAQREVHQQEGAKAAFATAKSAIEQLLNHLKKDIEDGKYSLEQGSEISKWIQRASAICESLGVSATNTLIAKSGAYEQNKRLVDLIRKRMDSETAKLRELELLARAQQHAGVGPAGEMDPTAPPAPKSIKQLRLEEAAREAAAAAQGTLEPPVLPVEPDEPPPAPVASEKHGKANGKRGKGSRGAAHA